MLTVFLWHTWQHNRSNQKFTSCSLTVRTFLHGPFDVSVPLNHIKGIVHFEIKIWYLSAYPKGIQDVGVFFSSVDPIFGIRCVTCVCARYGSRCIHTGRRHQRLTEGVSEAWCWRAVIVTTTNHILLWCCMNGIGYLHEAIWLADASVGAWKVEKFSTSAASSASEATRRTHSSVRQCLTSLHSKSTRGVDADAPCEWGVSLRKRRKAPEVISRAYTSLIARAHTLDACAHSDHLDMVVYKR